MPNEKTAPQNYLHLQKSIDTVVGKIGLHQTIHLLESFINNTTAKHTEHEKVKLVTHYTIGLAIKVYELQEEHFFTSSIREYRDARMSCYHLLRKYTQETLPKIGLSFGCSERTVEYGCNKTSERLAVPKGNTAFVSSYRSIEGGIIEFIGKIN